MKPQFAGNHQPVVTSHDGECAKPRLPIPRPTAPNPGIPAFPRVSPLHPPSTELQSLKAELREQVYAVCRQIREAFAIANKRAVGDRLNWEDQLAVLQAVYRAVWQWRRGGWRHTVSAMLRRLAPGRIWRKSGLMLVVLRSALPDLCPKRASKWSSALELAYHHEIDPDRLGAFLHEWGGIDGAAKEWVEIRCGDWE